MSRVALRAWRRGSNAVEFAIMLPLLLILVSGVVDLGRFLHLADATVAAVAEGARGGALADVPGGEDPVVVSVAAADTYWLATENAATLTVTSRVVGAAPDAMLEVMGVLTFDASFGLLGLPATACYTQTIRLFHQP